MLAVRVLPSMPRLETLNSGARLHRQRSTAEVWCLHGLVSYYVFFVIELATRIVHIAGITAQGNEGCMLEIARNLTDERLRVPRAHEPRGGYIKR